MTIVFDDIVINIIIWCTPVSEICLVTIRGRNRDIFMPF